MPNIIKQEQGLLYKEDFSNPSLVWTLSPSDANNLEFVNNKLRLKHTSEYVTYTIIEPELDEYACIVKIDHAPYDVNDIAGVLILHTNKQYIECQTFLSDTSSLIGTQYTLSNILSDLNLADEYVKYNINESSENQEGESEQEDENPHDGDIKYNYIKVYKKNGVYSFFASNDNLTWIEVGDVSMPLAGALGFFIYKGNDDIINNSHCYIEQFDLYKSKYVRINNIPEDSNFEIHDGLQIICRSDASNYNSILNFTDTGILINTTNLPMPMSPMFLRFYDEDDYTSTIVEYNLGTVYGGDIFNIETDVRFYLNNNQINPGEITDLGVLYINKSYIKIIIENHDTIVATSRTLNVERYSDYYSGNKPILLCLTTENEIPEYDLFQKSVIIPELQPNETINLYMCLKEKSLPDYFLNANELRFKLIIT